jgi:hypothetical protein
MFKLKNPFKKIYSLIFKTDKLSLREEYIYLTGKARALEIHLNTLKDTLSDKNKTLLESSRFKPYIFLNPNTNNVGVGFLLNIETVKTFDWITTQATVIDFNNSHEILKLELSYLKTFTIASLVYILFPKNHQFMIWSLVNTMAVNTTVDKPVQTWQEISDILTSSHFWNMLENFSNKLDYYDQTTLSQTTFINRLNSYKAIDNIKGM